MKIESVPQSIEIEQQVLGAILIEPDCLENVNTLLQPSYFFEEKHRIIYQCFIEMNKAETPIDLLTTYEYLKSSKKLSDAGDLKYLTIIAESISSSANVDYLARVVFEKYVGRQIISKCISLVERVNQIGANEDVFDLVSDAESEFSNVTAQIEKLSSEEKPLSDRIEEIFSDLQNRLNEQNSTASLKLTSLPSLNKIIGGIMPKDLIAIYGKEKSTKTTLAHEIAMDIGADQKIPVGIFTFENSKQETDWKSISMRTGIEFNKLRNPKGYSSDSKLTLAEIEQLKKNSMEKFRGSKILICDLILNEFEIASKIRYWKKKFDIKLCVIDYLMLINSIEKFQNRREELNHLSRFFKRLSMKLEIPIILISQSNAEGERAAEAKGLERDSNYFIYVQAGEPGQKIKFNDSSYGSYTYSLNEDEFIVTVRGIRHAKGNRSFITRFQDNRYVEVDTIPRAGLYPQHQEKNPNWYAKEQKEFPI